MPGSSPAIQSEFRPRYVLKWYFSILFGLFVTLMYIRSKMIGEDITSYIEVIAISAIIFALYAMAHTIRVIEFGSKLRVKYVLWPAKAYEYETILEVRLPKIEIESQSPLNVENFANLDELQQEFRNLEFMGVVPRGHIREMRFDEPETISKPKLGSMIWAAITILALGYELFRISEEVQILWVLIIGVYFLSEIFGRLFRKPQDE